MKVEELKGISRKIFGGLAASYELVLDLATFYQDRRWKDWVARRVRASPNEAVLDVGCGTLVLEERMPRTTFLGLDLSPEMVRVAKAKRAPNVTMLAYADAEFLPVSDASFDVLGS